MKLGLASYAYAWAIGVPGSVPDQHMTALDLVDRAASLGVHVVQIADNLPLHMFSEHELAELQSVARTNESQIEVGTRGIKPDLLMRYLEIADFLGASFVRTVVDTADHHPDPPEIVSTLRPLLSDFERAGVRLAIENHDRFTTADLIGLLEALDHTSVGICLDTVNSYGAQEGMRAVAEALAPWTINLHVKDYTIQRLWHNMGFTIEGRPAGQGMLDIPWLLDLVRTEGIDSPNAVIELWPAREDTLEATIAKEDAWVAQSVAYMRGLVPG